MRIQTESTMDIGLFNFVTLLQENMRVQLGTALRM